MLINIIYALVSLIFLFLLYLIIKSIIRGINGKKIDLEKNNFKRY